MLWSYLKIAWKVLLRRKFFTFISLFAISFTLVVLMVATALLDHLFAPGGPEPHRDRTLYVMGISLTGPGGSRNSGAGYALLDRQVRTLPGVEGVSIVSMPNQRPIYHDADKLSTYVRHADGAYWRITDFEFLEGSPFTDVDDRDGRHVAVINAAMRNRLFEGEPAVGRTFQMDGRAFRVVGVVRDVAMTRLMAFSEVWIPIGTMKGDAYRRELVGDFAGMILAHDRSDFPAIKAEFAARLRRMELPDPRTHDTIHGGADTLFESFSRTALGSNQDESHPAWLGAIVAGGMLLFMLLPTVNLININLSRILERASEIGVRKAFGASSRTLVGQFVVENVVLTVVGGAIGLIGSWIVLTALKGSGIIPYADFNLNLRIFAYGIFLAVFFGVLSGVYPAWKMSRLHPAEALGGRTT